MQAGVINVCSTSNKDEVHPNIVYKELITQSLVKCLFNVDSICFVVMQAEFSTEAGTRTTIVLRLDRDFIGNIMGRPVDVGPPDWTSMHSVGLLLSLRDVHGNPATKEKFHDGPFSIILHSIALEFD